MKNPFSLFITCLVVEDYQISIKLLKSNQHYQNIFNLNIIYFHMRFAIIYYKENIAGKTIVDEFKKLAFAPQVPIIELDKETIYSNDISKEKYPELAIIDFLVFASTHRSKDNKPALCLHTPGNFRSADLGGNPGKVCPTKANVLKYMFKQFEKNYNSSVRIKEKYILTMEATHHGPDVNIPCCFIELGATETEWTDKEAAKIVAKTISSLQNYKESNHPTAICIGGPHYCPNFNQIQLSSNFAISHVIPNYAFPVTESMLKEAESKTQEQIDTIIIDWKGCGKSEERQQVIDIIEKLGFKYERSRDVGK
jgi:D-aminoacyl-tRNA deacylase